MTQDVQRYSHAPAPILHDLMTYCANMKGWRSRLVQKIVVYSCPNGPFVVALVSANSIHDSGICVGLSTLFTKGQQGVVLFVLQLGTLLTIFMNVITGICVGCSGDAWLEKRP